MAKQLGTELCGRRLFCGANPRSRIRRSCHMRICIKSEDYSMLHKNRADYPPVRFLCASLNLSCFSDSKGVRIHIIDLIIALPLFVSAELWRLSTAPRKARSLLLAFGSSLSVRFLTSACHVWSVAPRS